MGLLDRMKSAGAKGLEYTGKLLKSPFSVMKWTHDKVFDVLNKRTYAASGAIGDKVTTLPALKAANRVLGANEADVYEQRPLAKTRRNISKSLESHIPHANRIFLGRNEEAIRMEERLLDRYKASIEYDLSTSPEGPTVSDRMMMRRLTELINISRPGHPLTLLSSSHPISKITHQKTDCYSLKGIDDEDPAPLAFLLFPPTPRKTLVKTGDVERTVFPRPLSRKPRLKGLTHDERRRMIEAPVINESDTGTSYSCKIAETDYDYAKRAKANQSSRASIESFPITLEMHVGEEGYPEGGDPFRLYEKLYAVYKDQLQDSHWEQLSLSLVKRGSKITLCGFLTRRRPHVPETLPEPALPSHFDDNWWYAQAVTAIDDFAPVYQNESRLISFCCQQPDRAFDEKAPKVDPSDFKEERHQLLFSIVKKLHDSKSPLTPAKIRDELIALGKIVEAGGTPYISHVFFDHLPADYSQNTAVMLLQKKKVARALFQDPEFHSGVSVLAYTQLELAVQALHDAPSSLDVAIVEDASQNLPRLEGDTYVFGLRVNGETDTLQLKKGTDIFVFPEESRLKSFLFEEFDEDQSSLTAEQIIQRLQDRRPKINKRARKLS